MSQFHTMRYSRRRWLTSHALGLAAVISRPARAAGWSTSGRRSDPSSPRSGAAEHAARIAVQAERRDLVPWRVLAQQAVDVARTAGAQYADARLTRIVRHDYTVDGDAHSGGVPWLIGDDETVGIGVRALVDGYWGFSASAVIAPDEVTRLADDAVAQATENAQGSPWTVDFGVIPVATGDWTTPIRMDPFTISIEEKLDNILYWKQCAAEAGVSGVYAWLPSWLRFVRQEQVVATSEGALFTQTVYESGGFLLGGIPKPRGSGYLATQAVHGIDIAGAGWELFLDAKIPDQFLSGQLSQEIKQQAAIPTKPLAIGRYTLVCDGATMVALVESTLGVATQLDRALGYEANAGGTSFIDDPLAMVGHLQVAAPMVTLTANRSTPRDLATVKWDTEGVEPEPFTLIKDGVLVDFQTTREQAAWLAPYYQQHQQPVRSHGCAAVENAHVIPMQHMPNLSLEPAASALQVEDLVADVTEGILVEGGQVGDTDFQARTGHLGGGMREIKNGRLGHRLEGGVVLFNSQELWKAITVVGGPTTQGEIGYSPYRLFLEGGDARDWLLPKGQPSQNTSHSVRAVAATIPNQPLIIPGNKA